MAKGDGLCELILGIGLLVIMGKHLLISNLDLPGSSQLSERWWAKYHKTRAMYSLSSLLVQKPAQKAPTVEPITSW
jgi:hypothetical protein